MSAHEDEFPITVPSDSAWQPPLHEKLCDCECSDRCPNGRTGSAERCKILVRDAAAHADEPNESKRWKILTSDGNWSTVSGRELRRDDDWIEIVGSGVRHCFHRPQSVEQMT